jgi:MGT family glycosyltransferase
MNTILIYTSPARGHLYPIMDIAIGLRSEGHRVVMQTIASEKDNVIAEGIEYRPISVEIEKLVLEDYKITNPINQIKSTFARWLSRAPYEVEDLRNSCAEIVPDLLIVDVNTWGASAFAEAEGRPWVMFMPYLLPVPSPDTPAYGPGFPPPRNSLERLRDKTVRGIMKIAFKGIIKKLDDFRVKLGAKPIYAWENLFSKPDLLLYLTSEPFDYPRKEWPNNLHAVGPGLWAPSGEAPEWIDELPHPRVLVSVSTEFQEDGDIIDTALKALSNEKGSVIVTSASLDPEQFVAPNERIHITRFLHHASVIPKVDIVVTHGGMGTTQRALAAGVPVCVIPWGRDQNETARRVEYCRAGVMLHKKKLNTEFLRSAVREAQTRKEEAERISTSFLKAGGPRRGVELIGKLLNITEEKR